MVGATALATLAMAGCGSGTSPVSGLTAATPTFSPGAGTYSSSQAVTISESTSGAVLYCTTDGSTPTTASPKCGQPTTVYQTEFLQAIAAAPGGSPSPIASAAYTIDLNAAATPTFSPAGGSFASAQTVTMADATSGANIYYTTDGSAPTASSTLYSGPIGVSQTETISAIAVASGYSSSGIGNATYAIALPVAAPSFSVPSGSYATAQTVILGDATTGASIYYTLDGSTPSAASNLYSSSTPISVTETETISAVAILNGQSSAVSVAAYEIGSSSSGVAAPTFSVPSGSYATAQTVSLSDATAGASLYYTTDGSTPTSSSNAYSGPISVPQTETINAIAVLAGQSSAVSVAAYAIGSTGGVASPSFSPAAGTYATAQTVGLSDTTTGASIHYTLDGSAPTSSSPLYSAPIRVAQTETISAIAISGSAQSSLAQATYTIPPSAPAFSEPSGSYPAAQTVSLSDATTGASLYYTLDGSTPSASSTAYTGPISVPQTETISAIAVLNGTGSSVSVGVYSINPVQAPVFSVAGGTYGAAQTVAISDASSGASIFYAINGGSATPTTPYSGPITVGATETLSAVAVLSGASSPLTTAAYTINQTPAAPVFSLASGSYTTTQSVTISAAAGASIYYAINGPASQSSSVYIGAIRVGQTETINAIAVVSGVASLPATAAYTISTTVPTPTFTPPSTVPATPVTVAVGSPIQIADGDNNATIYYTTDGSAPTDGTNPTGSATQYSSAQAITFTSPQASVTVLAVAVDAASSLYSSTGYATYKVVPRTPAPTVTPTGGTAASPATVTLGQTVTIADTDSNPTTIYYTTDGNAPQQIPADLYHAGGFPLSTAASSVVVQAIAVDQTTGLPSAATTAVYTVAPPGPAFAPANNSSVTEGVTEIAISDSADSAAAIYYTIGGGTPSASSTRYSAPFTLSGTGSVVVKAIAIDNGVSSTATTANYAVSASVQPPSFTPAGGATSSSPTAIAAGTQLVTISDATGGATIYYTTDGTAPTNSSSAYTAGTPIALPAGAAVNLRAIAYVGASSSGATSAFYDSTPAPPTFSVAAGSYTSAQTVTISDTDGNGSAHIYYTANGSVPTSGSTLYSGAITVSSTETLKAIDIDNGVDSGVASAAYTISLGTPITGKVLSGTAGVDGATVKLYAAGNSGYGSAATLIGAAAAPTTSTGAFTLNVSCPPAPAGAQVYLVATGGSTTAGDDNPDLEMMTALGPCANIASGASFTINEATTVASAYALAQFMTTAPNVGSSSANYAVGLTNAFAGVGNLVDVNSGAALTVTPGYAQTFAQDTNILNNSTVPTARINTLANILNSCTSTANGGGCSAGLFTDATPPSGTAPTNTLQAILDIAQNPGTSNVGNLYGLATTAFSPALNQGAPNDWTLALTFTGGGLGIAPGLTNLTYTPAGGSPTGPGSLEIVNTSLAIDAAGNIWVTAYADDLSPGYPQISNGQASLVAEFNHLGAALTSQTTIDGSGNVAFGGFNPDPNNAGALAASAIDQVGNLWFSEVLNNLSAGYLIKAGPQPSVLLTPLPSGGVNPQDLTDPIAMDPANNIWAAFADVTPVEYETNGSPVPVSGSPSAPATPLGYLDFDSSGNLWATPSGDVVQLDANGSVVYDAFGGGGSLTTLASDGAGNIYGCGGSNSQLLNVFKAGASNPLNSYPINTTRGCGTQLVLDGQGRLFAVSNENGGVPLAAVDEFTTAGGQISPTPNGYTGTSSSEAPTLNPDYGFFSAVPGVGAGIDPSGNLWVLNNDAAGLDASNNPHPGNALVEFIGLAAPVVTPTSVALKNSTLGHAGGLGTRP